MVKKQMKLGILIQGPGGHMHAWKSPEVPADASIHIEHYVKVTQKAEANDLDFVFIADGLHIHEGSIPHFLNRFEPLTLLSTLAATTETIGLVGTVSTTYSEPFNVARQFASLDHLSKGRAGWNVVTSPLENTAKNFQKGNHPAHALRYEMAHEYVEVVKGLWDSWEDDAFVRDRSSGQFFHPEKMHRLDYKGKYFAVEGPLNIARSKQGQPVIFQAGASDTGMDFAARHGEAIFTNKSSLEAAQSYYRKLKDRARSYGRAANDLVILPALSPIVGETDAQAEAVYDEIKSYVTIEDALQYLGRFFDHFDFTTFPLDEEFPNIGDIGANSFQSTTDDIKRMAKEEGLSLREVALRVATPKHSFIGSYEKVAAEMIRWVEEEAADGFILSMPVFGKQYDAFLQKVLPILQKEAYVGIGEKKPTLRGNLGLDIPENTNVKKLEMKEN